jgi:hypothetical protein
MIRAAPSLPLQLRLARGARQIFVQARLWHPDLFGHGPKCRRIDCAPR